MLPCIHYSLHETRRRSGSHHRLLGTAWIDATSQRFGGDSQTCSVSCTETHLMSWSYRFCFKRRSFSMSIRYGASILSCAGSYFFVDGKPWGFFIIGVKPDVRERCSSARISSISSRSSELRCMSLLRSRGRNERERRL